MLKPRKAPLRKCIGCREMKDKRQLIRIVRFENKQDEAIGFSLDYTGKKPGRGAYICPNLTCFEAACKQKGLERSFKEAIPKEIYAQLRADMEKES